MSDFEMFREVVRITEWDGDEVKATKSKGARWIDEDVVLYNQPTKSNIMYVSVADDHPMASRVTFRRKWSK